MRAGPVKTRRTPRQSHLPAVRLRRGDILTELCRALRTLGRAPGFAAVAIGTLALTIGSASAMFGLVDSVLLAPLPMRAPAQLVRLHEVDLGRGIPSVETSFPKFRAWKAGLGAFQQLAALLQVNIDVAFDEDGERRTVLGRPVSGEFFDVLDAPPLLGRTLTAADDRPGAVPVVVVSHGFWQRIFGGASDVLGRRLVLDGDPYEIVGVMPREFQYPEAAEFWVPLSAVVPADVLEAPGIGFLTVVGRLDGGATRAAAAVELGALASRMAREEIDAGARRRAGVTPLNR